MRSFASLRRRGDFSRLRQRGRRLPMACATLYLGGPAAGDGQPLLGISVAKTVGNAVARNRVRRRFAAVFHEVLASAPPMRLLLVARPDAAATPFADLRAQVEAALGSGRH
jgi:ribonuclease P protein component